ncbi:hypothetical protein [Mariniflexile sp.]
MINSTFNEQSQILETEFKADINAEEVLDYIKSFKDNTSYPRKLKGIIDARNATFNFSFRDIEFFNDENNKTLESYEIAIFAIIIDSPETAALSTLYETIAINEKYEFKVFSTYEAALLWIKGFNF